MAPASFAFCSSPESANEVMVTTMIYDHAARRHSYELLAEEFGFSQVALVVFVLVINQLLGRPFLESLLFSVALAVGMSPELMKQQIEFYKQRYGEKAAGGQ